MERIKIEIRKEKACCKDLVTAINLHVMRDDYQLMVNCAEKIQKSAQKIEKLEAQFKVERDKVLYETVERLSREGKIVRIGARPRP